MILMAALSPPWWAVFLFTLTTLAAIALARKFTWPRAIVLSVLLHAGIVGVLAGRQQPARSGHGRETPVARKLPVLNRELPPLIRRPGRETPRPLAGPGGTPRPGVVPLISRKARIPSPTRPLPTLLGQVGPGVGTIPGGSADDSPRLLPGVATVGLEGPSIAVARPRPAARPRLPVAVPLPATRAGGLPLMPILGGPTAADIRPEPLASLPVARLGTGTLFDLSGSHGPQVFVVDMSLSMEEHGKHIAVLRQLLLALRQIGTDTEVEVIFFHSKFVALNGGPRPRLARSGPDLIRRVEQLIERNVRWARSTPTSNARKRQPGDILPEGGTVPQDPLLAACALKPGKIHFLTDGEIMTRYLDLKAIPANGPTIIDSVEIGPPPAPEARVQEARLIARLARGHGGTYRYVPVEPVKDKP